MNTPVIPYRRPNLHVGGLMIVLKILFWLVVLAIIQGALEGLGL